MNSTEVKAYWEERFAGGVSLSTTGWLGLGPAFNDWMYRIRRKHFLRTVAPIIDAPNARVLDVGSGSGFYLGLWRELGVGHLTGSDLTDNAVTALKAHHACDIVQLDITQSIPEAWRGTFDAVSAMDMLYHIVDDQLYAAAFKNLAALLKPEGTLIISENCLHRPSPIVGPHQVCRTLAHVNLCANDAGLIIVARKPVFYLMNTPLDSDSRALQWSWRAVSKLARTRNELGNVVGAMLYPVEWALTNATQEGPSTEMLLLHRTPD